MFCCVVEGCKAPGGCTERRRDQALLASILVVGVPKELDEGGEGRWLSTQTMDSASVSIPWI